MHVNFLSARLKMVLIQREHAQLAHAFLRDPQLYLYLPKDAPSLADVERQFSFWENRISPDKSEFWLNWAVFWKEACIGTMQAGVHRASKEASIAYMIATGYQGKGLGTEATGAMIDHLHQHYKVRRVKAWIDTRNRASIRLVEKLGLQKVEWIQNADHFKGASSDEFVFQKDLGG